MLENIGLGLFPFTEVQHPEKNVFSISQRVRSIVSDEFPWVRWCFWRHHVFFCTTLHIGMNAFLAVASAFLFEHKNKMTTLFEEGGPMDQWGTNPTIIPPDLSTAGEPYFWAWWWSWQLSQPKWQNRRESFGYFRKPFSDRTIHRTKCIASFVSPMALFLRWIQFEST